MTVIFVLCGLAGIAASYLLAPKAGKYENVGTKENPMWVPLRKNRTLIDAYVNGK